MSRAVTYDHILFNECIEAFRPHSGAATGSRRDSPEYLLFDFPLTEPLAILDFIVGPTLEVVLDEHHKSFVASVKLPEWYLDDHGHLFTLAASTVFSFLLGRAVNSTRDSGKEAGQARPAGVDWRAIGSRLPVITVGLGCQWPLARTRLAPFREQANWLIALLRQMPPQDYVDIMYALRLVHLSHLTLREDLALSYYLLVSAIEAVAQKAITKEMVLPPEPDEQRWRELSRANTDFRNLYRQYRKARGSNHFLKKRFVEFVLKYCPHEQWEQMPYPLAEWVVEVSDSTPPERLLLHNRPRPNQLTVADARVVLGRAYDHRSRFTHSGENPPHRSPELYGSYFESFNEFYIDRENSENPLRWRPILVVGHALMAFIARTSILAYLREQHS